ncbi:hypothetical protein GCM10009838_78570 [Catenulispora subtropica]|uniref:Uncharacterized protein n=1 Tax=Catenulispora subtropica TaxID=450798 RepID=A0ABN2T8F8_9ACTN
MYAVLNAVVSKRADPAEVWEQRYAAAGAVLTRRPQRQPPDRGHSPRTPGTLGSDVSSMTPVQQVAVPA